MLAQAFSSVWWDKVYGEAGNLSRAALLWILPTHLPTDVEAFTAAALWSLLLDPQNGLL